MSFYGMTFAVNYLDSRGAGCTQYFRTENSLKKFITKLRKEAEIFAILPGRLDRIGAIERCNYVHDSERKWFWWFEIRNRKITGYN